MGTSKGHRGLYTKRGGGKGHPTHTPVSGLGESKSANTWIPDFQLTQFEKISCALFKLVFCCGLGNGIDGADWAAWKSVFGARTRTSMAIRQMPAWVKAMQSRHGWLKQENRLWKHHYSSRSTGKVAMVSQTAEDSKQRGVCLQAAFWVQAAEPLLDICSSILVFTSSHNTFDTFSDWQCCVAQKVWRYSCAFKSFWIVYKS